MGQKILGEGGLGRAVTLLVEGGISKINPPLRETLHLSNVMTSQCSIIVW